MIHANPRPPPKVRPKGSTPSGLLRRVLLQGQLGHADEFIRFFKKNHYPVLKSGSIAAACFACPPSNRAITQRRRRWDYRVTIVFERGGGVRRAAGKRRSRRSFFLTERPSAQRKNAGRDLFGPLERADR